MEVVPEEILEIYKGDKSKKKNLNNLFKKLMKSGIEDDETEDVTPPKSLIQGIHSYDILQNPKYQLMFQYSPVTKDSEDRAHGIRDGDKDDSNDHIQSDLIRMVLNLPFMHKNDRNMFTFSSQGYMDYIKGYQTPSRDYYTTIQ